jgi:hypothetical protein
MRFEQSEACGARAARAWLQQRISSRIEYSALIPANVLLEEQSRFPCPLTRSGFHERLEMQKAKKYQYH